MSRSFSVKVLILVISGWKAEQYLFILYNVQAPVMSFILVITLCDAGSLQRDQCRGASTLLYNWHLVNYSYSLLSSYDYFNIVYDLEIIFVLCIRSIGEMAQKVRRVRLPQSESLLLAGWPWAGHLISDIQLLHPLNDHNDSNYSYFIG